MNCENKPKLMIVDDSPEDIHILIAALKDDYTLVAATSADDALQRLGENDHPLIILMDVNMPGTNGYDACKMIKADDGLKDIDIVFLSANDTNDEIIRGLEAGALDYLVKPFDIDLLVSKIKQAIISREARQQLRKEAEAASSLVTTVMSESGALANIVEFLSESFTVDNVSELGKALLTTLQRHELNVVLSFNLDPIRETFSSSGEISMLEVELMDRMHKHQAPFVEQGERLFVIQDYIVLFVKNMPLEPEKRGALKDHIMVLLKGANAKLDFFAKQAETNNKKMRKLKTALLHAKATLDEIHLEQEAHKKDNMGILDEMVAKVESSFFALGLTDDQEAGLTAILSDAVHSSLTHMEQGLEIDGKIKSIITELSTVAHEVSG